MQTLFIKIMLLPISLLAACSSKSHRPADFIPGICVNRAQDGSSIARDTPEVRPDPFGERAYRISDHTGFRRVKNRALQPKEQVSKLFNGHWDVQKQILAITETGVFLLFEPGGKRLKMKNSSYTKNREGL